MARSEIRHQTDFYSIIRPTRLQSERVGEPEGVQPLQGSRRNLLETYWVLCVFGLLAAVVILAPSIRLPVAPVERTFRIEASNFEYTPAIIRVNPGDLVTIELISKDVTHGIYLDGYDLEVKAEPGQTARLSFIADKTGTYRMRCSVTCGSLHPFMIGKLVVGPNNLLFKSLGIALLAVVVGIWSVRK
jgi:cytochrome c oxidase subunit 2